MKSPIQALEAAKMFVIARHGNTFESGEIPRRIGARTDLSLTATGLEQSCALGKHFARQSLRFDRVLVSPLARTQQTARAILAELDDAPSPETSEFLREIDHGPDENQPDDVVRARVGDAALAAWESDARPPDGWIIDTEDRVSAWRRLFTDSRARQRTSLLVTSNGAARFALLADDDLAQQADELSTLKLPTGGFGVIDFNEDGALRLREWGVCP
ncbi:MAG: histidine phosphatase family protein [Pseudomonadota bacterium]